MNYKFLMATLVVSTAFVSACDNNEEVKTEIKEVPVNVIKEIGTGYSVGSRPLYLVDDMDAGNLKDKLASCKDKPIKPTLFSIGHRGAAMQYPEHTKESYVAAARQGAGIVECDVTFTKDKELVCRHSQCDLHTTTNILKTDLANKCSVPPAFDATGKLTNAADIKCCTSDITLSEFKTLKGKMDAANKKADNIDDFMNATAGWRTDLYTQNGTLLSHKESIALFKKLGVKMTPELKGASVEMPYEGFTQEQYAQKMIDEIKAANVPASDVWAQSFNLADVKYWIANEPSFGAQAVFLDDRYDLNQADKTTWNPSMEDLADAGVKYVAPPMWMLVQGKAGNTRPTPSPYAEEAKANNLNIITWTLERSGPLAKGGGWYYSSVKDITNNDGDMLTLLDVLAKDVGVKGVFSDWPATTSYYANCMGLS